MLDHKGTLRIETDNLILRRFTAGDADAMYNNWASDDEVTKFLSWPTHKDIAITNKVVSSWLDEYEKNDFYHWAIEEKSSGEVVGNITVVNQSGLHEHCELGYCIGKSFWGKGITKDALVRVINYLFTEVGFERIEAIHHLENKSSGRVMIKAGMTYEGRKRRYHKNKFGEFVDCELYSIVKGDVQ